jgi:glycosyltransferase involved in cell wall biosynthesis
MNPLRDVGGIADLAVKLRSIRPGVALGYSIKPVIYGTLAARMAGVPQRFAMIEGLGHVFMDQPTLKGRVLRMAVSALYRIALARTTRTFFLNEDDNTDFLRLGLLDARKTKVIGAIGVDLSKWMPAQPVKSPMTFLFIGRLLREKGIVELIKAARIVKGRHPHTRFILLGDIDGNPSSLTRAEVEAWVAEGLITWPGQVDVAPWIARASVFVLPSYREGVPRSTQEAMAMGRPVITTDVPGCRDTVVDRVNGLLVPARNAGALADAMLRFVTEPQLVETMGRASRAMAEDRFDVEKANARLISEIGL